MKQIKDLKLLVLLAKGGCPRVWPATIECHCCPFENVCFVLLNQETPAWSISRELPPVAYSSMKLLAKKAIREML